MIWILAQESGNQQTGGSIITLLLPLVMIVGLYFILIRPQRTRQKQQQAMLGALQVGDEVIISGGIYGTVRDIDDDTGTVRVEIAPGTEVHMLRQGVVQRLTEEPDDASYDDDYDEGVDTSGEETDDRR